MFPNQLDTTNFLTLFYKVFVIYNFKRFNTSNQLGNAAIQGDNKLGFLFLVACLKQIQNVRYLPLTNKQGRGLCGKDTFTTIGL